MLVNFEVIKDMSAADQRQILIDLDQKREETQQQLANRADYKRIVFLFNQSGDAVTYDELKKAQDDLSPETKALWEALETQSNQLRNIKSYLYLHSSEAEIRKDMEAIVNTFIRESFDETKLMGRAPRKISEIVYYQGLLHLSTFGGKMKTDGPDSFSYEFNAENADGHELSVPFNPIERLFEKGLLKVYDEATTENNLTLLGQAVLARLNEMRALPAEVLEFKKLTPTEEPSNATSGERRHPQSGSAPTATPK